MTSDKWPDFRSRLREDFRPFPLARLALFPGSLSAVQGVLVPIIAFTFQDMLNYAINYAGVQVQMLGIIHKNPGAILGILGLVVIPYFFTINGCYSIK
ncbi:MAG: hypothetical protein NTV38_02555 [Chloroflexi bacterium]|nr:hypothetical protein [Chloroflexota bacterium]